MFTIGEFSRINKITTRTLRHYDAIGLLKPAKTDSWTGYRYYTDDQLPVISRIITFRDLGYRLDEIGRLLELADAGTAESKKQLADSLKRRQKRIASIIHGEELRLGRLETFLAGLVEGTKKKESGEKSMKHEVVIKSLPEVIVASMRTIIPGYDTYFDIVPKMGDYMRSVGAVCREPSYCFTIYHDEEYRESDIDVEICEAVVEACQESEMVKFRTISEVGKAACLLHKGPYSTLRQSYNALFQWIGENGYEIAGNPRESYIDGIWNREDEADWLTEIQVPIT